MDRERRLRLDFNALILIDQATGLRSLEGEPWEAEHAARPEVLRALLWACLRDEDPRLTLEDAGRLLTPANCGRVAGAIGRLYRAGAACGRGEISHSSSFVAGALSSAEAQRLLAAAYGREHK